MVILIMHKSEKCLAAKKSRQDSTGNLIVNLVSFRSIT